MRFVSGILETTINTGDLFFVFLLSSSFYQLLPIFNGKTLYSHGLYQKDYFCSYYLQQSPEKAYYFGIDLLCRGQGD